MPVTSASAPSAAAPTPARPNDSPKNSPEIVPTLPGTRSIAYTTIAEEADARVSPITTVRIAVHASPTCGKARVNGINPRIEPQITDLRPIRSPTGQPISDPTATAARNTNR